MKDQLQVGKLIEDLRLLCEKQARRTEGSLVRDFAFLGSTSGRYGYYGTGSVDFDFWILADQIKNPQIVKWLKDFRENFEVWTASHGIATSSVRVVDGPYKIEPQSGQDLAFLVHVLLDDNVSLRKRPSTTRYCWGKYETKILGTSLAEVAPESITIDDVMNSRWGICDSLQSLRNGFVTYREFDQENGESRQLEIETGTFLFSEFAAYCVMTNARNIGRSLGAKVADTFDNEAYIEWFSTTFEDPLVRIVFKLRKMLRRRPLRKEEHRHLHALAQTWIECAHRRLTSGGNPGVGAC